MKYTFYILFIFVVVAAGCSKDEDIRTSGIDSIDNTVYKSTTYYSYGFLFSAARKASTLESPGPDLTLYLDTNQFSPALTFQSDNFLDSFFLFGNYSDETKAIAAFKSLIQVPQASWSGMAAPVTPNQIWIYRTAGEQYVKIRIVSTRLETRNNLPFAECTFEWVFQPDGSDSFPGK